MASDDNKTRAEQLKADGNALYVRNDFPAARSKYTQAIKLDDSNPVLYSNRAATYIALKQYLDAAKDARKAVDLDSKNGKAWARLGKSAYELRLHELSVDAWKKALETLPAAGPSPQEEQLKNHFEEGLKLAESSLAAAKDRSMSDNRMFTFPNSPDKWPWMKALAMEDGLTANNVLNTCAWPLMNAYKDFSDGVKYMKQLKRTETGAEGNLNALQLIVGGILRDQRVFHMDAADWIENLQLQVEFELAAFGGWPEGGAETIKEAAVKLLEDKGWKATRLALGATIRAWFLRAYFADRSGQSKTVAMQYYNSIVDVLEWGAKTWHGVPTSDRGVIFLKTFVRAIRRIRLETYLSALREYEAAAGDENPQFKVEELIDMANQMVEETSNNMPKAGDDTPVDKGAWYSFYVCPIAEAHATLGAVFLQQGLSAKQEGDAEEAENMLAAAAKFYKKAAEMYPPDDENFPFFLKISFEAEWHRGRPLSETLPLCDRIRKALPAVAKIWEFNPADKLRSHIHQLDEFETRAYTGLLEGKLAMDTPSSNIALNF
ncbi:transporter [Ganoderma sinense ZZ0214-1]|uniref:Transporter n=1 Tax=Ganoderma sinense ZZ0214-1 TaxID=1077348 RepID=A0A2G8SCK3_9APHY|nr:transporter [Ganoderma sinense ZZ0214-1]